MDEEAKPGCSSWIYGQPKGQPIPNEEDKLKGIPVFPKRDCPHTSQVQPVPTGISIKDPCVECNTDIENWICLICYTVHCSRYINMHMSIHYMDNEHAISLSFSDLSVWCYVCDGYIDHEDLNEAKNAFHIAKFGHGIPVIEIELN